MTELESTSAGAVPMLEETPDSRSEHGTLVSQRLNRTLDLGAFDAILPNGHISISAHANSDEIAAGELRRYPLSPIRVVLCLLSCPLANLALVKE